MSGASPFTEVCVGTFHHGPDRIGTDLAKGRRNTSSMKTSLLVLTAMSFATGLFAQVDLGGKVGFNYHFQGTSLGDKAPAGSPEPDATDGPGFHVGAFLQAELSDKFFLRPELLYSTRMASSQLTSDITLAGTRTVIDQETKGTLTYLEVPVLLGIRLSDKFSIHAGPGFGLLLGNKVNVSGTQAVTTPQGTVNTSLDATVSSTDGLRPVEIAGLVGLGYRTDRGLDLGIRFWRGFTALEESTDISKTNQNVVQLSIGYAFLRD